MVLDRPFADSFLVINHGGHGGIWRAYINGLVQLNLPLNCDDQLENSLMVQDAGLGKVQVIPRLTDKAAMESFMSSVNELCRNPIYEKKAKAFAATCTGLEHNGNSAVLLILNKLYLRMLSLRQQQEQHESV